MTNKSLFRNTELTYFKISIFLFAYLSLYLSLYLGEDSTGGAILDYGNQRNVIGEFIKNFNFAFFNYDVLPYTTRHSPILISFLAILKNLNLSEFMIKFIYIHINLLLPIFFYKSLKIKFKKIDTNYLFLLSILIFLSPTFRTLIIWPDSRILGVTLFTISIFYFLKFIDNNKFKYALYNIFFYTFSAYISPNFSLFSIFFVFCYFQKYNFFSKNFFKILIINLLLSLPAIYYIFILDINFFFAKATVNLPGEDKLFVNFFNQLLIIPTILFFYLFPFFLTKIIKIDLRQIFKINLSISVILVLISVNFFSYNIDFTGGGIFFHFSHLILNNSFIFYLISIISIYFIILIFFNDFKNILLLLIIFLGNPQTTIYHKYYDPIMLILFFTLIIINLNLRKIVEKKSIIIIYVYFSVFLAISNFKHLLN